MSACSRSGARLKRSTVLLYGAPGFATALPAIPVYILLPELYATQTALSVAAIGIVFMVARLFDVVTDPLVGWAIDRVATPWGRRKPWIALGGVICTPALMLVVSPAPDTGVPTLLTGLVLLYLGWTVFQIPYYAWASELSANHYQRTRLTAAREGMVLAGILAASALPVALAYAGVAEQSRFLVIAALTGLVGASAVTALLWFVPKEAAQPIARSENRGGLWHALRSNGLFRRLVTAWLINGLANGFAVVHFPFFVTHVLRADDTEKAWLLFIYIASGIVALPFWLSVSRRMGKIRSWVLALVASCAVFAWVPFLSADQVGLFGVVCVLTGIALSADMALPPSALADVTDWDRLRFDVDRTSSLFAVWTMASKFSLAAAAGIGLTTAAWFGFEANGGNDETALLAVAVLYAGVPVVLKLGVAALLYRFRLTERAQRAIRSRLDRGAEATARAAS